MKEKGAACVFTKCPQLRCNVVVPHSVFLEYLPIEGEEETDNKGQKFRYQYQEKYLQWHCKQFTDHNKNIKWCPNLKCSNIIERSDFAEKNTV